MRCEICGKRIVGKPIKTKIDSSVMDVCKECSRFGKVQREPRKPRKSPVKRRPARSRGPEPIYEVVEDYGKIIRAERESRGWSREDLAERINEKVSVINRIESERMEPDIKLAKKLERLLNIQLLEKFEGDETDKIEAGGFRGATIGDIARIKRS
ncbi:multiprotein bridging factor aMBF1 [Methanothermobacter wolfeii]|uniref:Multiprotein bridging factor aMBF1 n=1 Tax=Methanothermobacter wolfeii TaxID=145261 RepID=A0A9E7UL36_METWO|nr:MULTISPECIES: multiprotein bridging factor aMBF1 [Methanothermobacter]MDI6702946.1 multiprotein bridging factor aMBF1 [Methanothermobacter wolfeii]NLM03267.1 TIGR00270 family protein [Methanothermobacter wolfeii]QHN06513.1 TIGR00270 family protein [Methanothermobacter sp. THM-1]UXH31040.1 multiprotein bridging factor aMBF1 [Methanothermobacter wolfeii]SCM57502.1 putative HTH-type transcriptional regulator MJ0586 [Methanothermobacter wolfeii]